MLPKLLPRSAPLTGLSRPEPPSYDPSVCRSIKTLRPPFTEDVTEADMEAAALQYVRKVAGMRRPAPHNQEAFDNAVEAVTRATQELLRDVKVRGAGTRVRPADPAQV